ncbi:MAG: hypothetical protein NT118_05230 [Lentisphaerae bacterium]|nr:hypothetical protein [Lentisphaerota bacterium]
MISADGIMPVLLNLKDLYPDYRILFVSPSTQNCDLIRKNVHLWQCLLLLDAKILAPRRDNRFIIAVWVIKLLLMLSFSRNIIIKFGDTLFKHKSLLKVLKKISNTTEIQSLILPTLEDYHYAIKQHWAISKERKAAGNVSEPKNSIEYDYYLTSIPPDMVRTYYEADMPDGKIINAGYVRRMPQWINFVRESAREYIPKERKPYFLFILSTAGKRLDELEEPPLSELLAESLTVLKKFNSRIHTIFRPHAITDVEKFKLMLEKIDYENYSVDYGHPMILSSGAEFVIGNFFSTTLFDAYYLGIPVIEYSFYDRELLRRIGTKSYGSGCCDFFIDRDPGKLESVVASILSGNAHVTRDGSLIDTNFPVTPASFYESFSSLLK